MSKNMTKFVEIGRTFSYTFGRFPALRLLHILLGTMMLSLVIAEAIAFFPSRIFWSQEEIHRIERDTLMLLRANVDTTTFPTVSDTVKVGERLMAFSAVRGGVIMNMLGDELGSFGKAPSLRFTDALRDNQVQLSQNGNFIDIYFAQHRTGLAFPVILRLDGEVIHSAVIKRLSESFLVVLGVALISSLVLVVVVALVIVHPMQRLRDAAILATENPDQADSYRLRWTRRDELGEAARAFDQLLASVSVVQQDDIATNQEAMLRAPYAILTYDGKGKLLNANPATLHLFGVTSIDGMTQLPPNYLRLSDNNQRRDVSPIDLVQSGESEQICGVLTAKGLKHCHVTTVTIHRRRSETVSHYVLTLIDISEPISYALSLEGETKRLSAEAQGLRRRLGEQRQLFESCTVIMSNLQQMSATGEVDDGRALPYILIDSLVESWCAEAVRNGLISNRAVTGELPAIRGDIGLVDAIFRQALLAAYTRSPWNRPEIGIEVRQAVIGGELAFDVFSAPHDMVTPEPADPERKLALPIVTMGLKRALTRLGGRIIESRHGDKAFAFVIPAAEGGFRRNSTAA